MREPKGSLCSATKAMPPSSGRPGSSDSEPTSRKGSGNFRVVWLRPGARTAPPGGPGAVRWCRRFDALRACRFVAAVAPLGRRHASFAQTVLACSETGAAVNLWSLTGTARQLSSQAAELARRGMPRPLSATAAGKHSRGAPLFRCDRAFMNSAALVRSDRAVPSCAACGVAKAARCAIIGGGCLPRRATQEERARSRVQRARPRSRNPRSRQDERSVTPVLRPSRKGGAACLAERVPQPARKAGAQCQSVTTT